MTRVTRTAMPGTTTGATASGHGSLRRWEVHGTVQGVGFRPFVHRLAVLLDLSGSVRNIAGIVVIDAAGAPEDLEEFVVRLRSDAPPLARISEIVECRPEAVTARRGSGGFSVEPSVVRPVDADIAQPSAFVEVPPDAATCPACLAELLSPGDRRFGYPFVNCTDCGPRVTIIDDLPYDRSRTSMAEFELCQSCSSEYRDPADRRFHAEPIACPVCGPQIVWHATGEGSEDPVGAAALDAALRVLRSGGIIAVKGLGGYQLVCDAGDEDAVRRLRTAKHRPGKPFAVMVEDMAAIRSLACATGREERLLTSAARPIVLLRPWHRPPADLAAGVAPRAARLGLFLPTTPLHHLLLRAMGRPLVVTSGNIADEPILTDDDEAQRRLGPICDGLLGHDRPIRARYDDSVARVVANRTTLIRRARGYAPAEVGLPIPAPRPVLAVGSQLKNTFTLATGPHAVVGPYAGDMMSAQAYAEFEESVARTQRLHRITPEFVAHDLHPDYLPTRYANAWPREKRIGVQHHHAHIASCAAEHGVTEPVIGVAFDGLGYGGDGTLWGGEVLLADLRSYRRLARFGHAPMPGGQAAIRKPIRMALGYLFTGEVLGGPRPSRRQLTDFCDRLDGREDDYVKVVLLARSGVNSPWISSAGRLFDAAAAILGLCDAATFEGEAAIALEAAAAGVRADPLSWRITRVGDLWVLDTVALLTALLAGVLAGAPVPNLAAAFHAAVAAATADLVRRCAQLSTVQTVCLSGGVWQNQTLTEDVHGRLTAEGFRVLINERVPCNDGGISYGQAAIAAARTADR